MIVGRSTVLVTPSPSQQVVTSLSARAYAAIPALSSGSGELALVEMLLVVKRTTRCKDDVKIVGNASARSLALAVQYITSTSAGRYSAALLDLLESIQVSCRTLRERPIGR